MPGPSLFDSTMALTALGDRRYLASVNPAWNGPAAPNGGVLAAMMLRAAQAELGADGPPPRTVAAHFLEAPSAGPVHLVVEVMRRGRRVAACDVRMLQDERLICQATIVHSAVRPSGAQLHRRPPEMPAPEQVPVLDAAGVPMAPPVFEPVETRPVLGAAIFAGGQEALTGGWMALRDDDAPLDPARLCALCDLWWPAVFTMLDAPAPVPTLQLTVYLRRVGEPVAPPVLARFQTCEVAEGHIEESGELWSREGELLAESRQIALLPAAG